MVWLDAEGVRKVVVNSYLASRRRSKRPHPLLFLGPSGVGKTVAVRQAAQDIARATGEVFIDYGEFSRKTEEEKERLLKELQMEGRRPFFFVDVLLLSHEPSDFSGVPRQGKIAGLEVTRFVPLEWASLLFYYPGLVFLDEITNITRDDIRGVAYKLVDERRAGYLVLSPEVQIVAAGNRPEDSSGAMMLPAPLLNRLEVHQVGPPSAVGWFRYVERRWPEADPLLLGYLAKLASRPEAPEEPETLDQFVTPRSCEYLLEKEMDFRLGLGRPLTPEEMRCYATGWLGKKEGELLAAWWSRREEIEAFLQGGEEELSPPALWGVGVMVGRTVDILRKEVEPEQLPHRSLEIHLGRAACRILEKGREYGVPIFLGMRAFMEGEDPRVSGGKTLYLLRRMAGDTHREASRCFASFMNMRPEDYFRGKIEEVLEGEARETSLPEAQALISVAQRLMADQKVEVLKTLESLSRALRPLSQLVGEDFARALTQMDSVEAWEKLARDIAARDN